MLEDELKNAVLHYDNLLSYLGNIGKSKVIFEKSINYGRVIADSLIFTENKGVVGVEIKSGHDTIKRLPKQLESYSLVCNYVFVFCHDSHLKEVEELLKKPKFKHVGIISYDEFDNKAIAGLYKKATLSPFFSLRVLASILWKKELYQVLQMWIARPEQVAANTYKLKADSSGNGAAKHPGYLKKSYSFKMLLHIFTNIFSVKQGTKLICEIFIKDGFDPKKQLQQYHFNDEFDGDISFKIPYKKGDF